MTTDPLGELHRIDEWQSQNWGCRYEGQTWEMWKTLDKTKGEIARTLSPLGKVWLALDAANRSLRNAVTAHDGLDALAQEGNPTKGDLEREQMARQAVVDAGKEAHGLLVELLTAAASGLPLRAQLEASVAVGERMAEVA